MKSIRHTLATANAVILSLVVITGIFTSVASAESGQGDSHRAFSVSTPKHAEHDDHQDNQEEKKVEKTANHQLKRLLNSLEHLQKVRANVDKSHMNADRKTYMLNRLDQLISDISQKIAQLNSSGADTSAPVTNSWKATNVTDTTAKLTIKLNEPVIGYYVVTSSGSAAPTASQVKLGQDGTGQPAAIRGSGAITSGMTAYSVSGLTPATGYVAYFVAEDFSHNVQANAATVSWMTLSQSDVLPPVISSVSFSGTTSTGTTLSFSSSETGSVYYVALPSTSTVPSAGQIKLGQDASGQTTIHGSGAVASGANTLGINGLSASSTYVIYFIVTDSAGNIETATHALVVTTTS